MSSVKTFFRHCPSCGRRFEIRLVDKKLADSEGFIEHGPPVSLNPIIAARGLAPVVLGEDAPTLVGVKEFTYTYQCKHCGHMWSEIHDATRDAKAPPGYTGD